MSDLRRHHPAAVRSAHGLITRSIGTSILQGEYPAGSPLPAEGDLMERFGVSRTALREALKTLAAKGLVVSKTKVGTRVLGAAHWNMFDADILAWRLELGLDQHFLGRLFEIRQTLEPFAAALAATRRTAADLEHMRTALAAMARADHDRDSFAAVDLAFHLGVVNASGNVFMQSIESVIRTALAASFKLSSPVANPERHNHSVNQHARVFAAIEHRDAQAASDAMSEVIAEGARAAGIQKAEREIAGLTLRSYEV